MSDLMERPIIRLTHSSGSVWFIPWSNPCDAHAGQAMTCEQLTVALKHEIDREFQIACEMSHYCADGVLEARIDREHALGKMERRLQRLRERGTTFLDPAYAESGEAFARSNRAGPREGCISIDALIERFLPEGVNP